MKITVTLKNKDYLLPGSGEGSALIDADPVTTPDGFPYFPARTFKGLFREAVQEVLEIQGDHKKSRAIVTELFGKADGDDAALLKFRNLYLNDWDAIRKHLPKYKTAEALAFDPSRITAHYTAEVAQTAIKNDGVAQDRSLRNFQAIKPETTFEGSIEFDNDKVLAYNDILSRAELQLRFAGTKRNRGFGKVSVKLDIPTVFKSESFPPSSTSAQNQKISALQITLTTASATVLSAITGDQNTVSSDSFVCGSRVRGLLAEKLIQLLKPGKNAHDNDLFHKAILSGLLHFRPAYPTDTKPIPLNIHRLKIDPNDLRDVFLKENLKDENGDDLITRTSGGIGRIEGNVIHKTKTTVSARFHNSRLDRSAGRNTENDLEGGIFYYEGVDAGQSFTGLITGDTTTLKSLYDQLPQDWEARIGKSKSTQYGDVKITLKPISELPFTPDLATADEVLLHFRSPVVLYNKCGMPAADVETLIEYLEQKGISGFVARAATRIENVETWNRQWKSRSGRIPAFGEGSVFLVKPSDEADETWDTGWKNLVKKGLGEMKEQGFGWVEVEAWDQFPKRLTLPKDSNSDSETPNQNTESGSEVDALPENIALREILEKFNENKQENAVRLHGLQFGEKQKSINNHLLSRLEQKMDALYQADSGLDTSAYQEWIEELKDKSAGLALKRIHLYEPLEKPMKILHGFKGDLPEEKKSKMAYLAWKAAFKNMRITNKIERKDDVKAV